ncbi:MAG: amino acid permease [Gemmatimonadota bacterium]
MEGGRNARLEKELGLSDVFVIAVGTMLSAGFFLLPGLAASNTGPSVILAYLLAGLFIVPSMLSTAELSTAMPRAGGTYYFLDRSLGPIVGTVGGLGTWLVLILKSAFALIGMGAYLSLFADLQIRPVAVGLTLLFGVVTLVGAKESTRLLRALVATVLSFVALYLVAGFLGLFAFRTPELPADVFRPFIDHGPEGLFATIGLVFISYAGLTKVSSMSEEVADPDRNIPRGMVLALLVGTIVYIAGIFLMVAAISPDVLHSDLTPVVTSGVEFLRWMPRPVAVVLLAVPALAGLAAAGNAGVLAASRYPLAMARDRLLPSPFAAVGRFGTPALAVVATVALMVVFILTLDVLSVAKLASTFQLLIFALVNLAVIVMRESGLEAYDPGYRSPFYPWLHLFGLLAPFLLIAMMGLMPIVFSIGLVGACLAWYFFYARDRVARDGALLHWFARLGRRRFEGLDTELRGILKEKGVRQEDPFDEVIARSSVLDLPAGITFEDTVRRAATLLAHRIPLPADRLAQGFLHGTRTGATPVAHGAALPHLRLTEAEAPQLVLARSRDGIEISVADAFPDEELHGERIFALFFLVSPEENPGQHLRILAEIAGRVDDADFMHAWLGVEHEQALKEAILRNERCLSLRLKPEQASGQLIGRALHEIEMPGGSLVALVRRGDEILVPRGQTVLRDGDRLTIVGDPEGIVAIQRRYGSLA